VQSEARAARKACSENVAETRRPRRTP
jgi:hypothetical protein